MTSANEGLAFEGMSMRFGGVQVFDNISLAIPPGRVTACIGPNGAGKTTLINVVCGVYAGQAGRVLLDGQAIAMRPHETLRHGIVRTFQDVRIFPLHSALENVLTAMPAQSGERLARLFRPGAGIAAEERRNREAAMALLDRIALTNVATRPAGELPFGQQKLLALARAIATGARYLLLDEPAAGVEGELVERVTTIIGELARREGRGALLVEHNIDVVRNVADHVAVLQGGGILASGPPERVLRDERVIREYLGRLYA